MSLLFEFLEATASHSVNGEADSRSSERQNYFRRSALNRSSRQPIRSFQSVQSLLKLPRPSSPIPPKSSIPFTTRRIKHGTQRASVSDNLPVPQFVLPPLTCGRFNQHVLIDPTPLPDHIPKVAEIGCSSAPLMSASYFIGARCREFNDDYMKCKTEAYGRGELECMKEGRKVTRCAARV